MRIKGVKTQLPKCTDQRRCFAKEDGKCTILSSTYGDKPCKFRKPVCDVTNGKYYPHRDLAKEIGEVS